MSRLKKRYNEEIRPALKETFKYKNVMQIPGLEKIVINMGIAEATKDKNAINDHLKEMGLLSGQKAVLARAKVSVANFKLREGQPVGIKVTLRGQRMFEFLDRFVTIVLPRVRDFRGLKTKSDGRGNYSMGLDDQTVFPELNLDDVKRTQGMNIAFVTTAQSDGECIELLRLLGMPFMNQTVHVAGSAA
jgi:large subunit ribosomal protein L5